MRSPSVFNFFSPGYMPIGEMTEQQLTAPELQLATSEMLPITQNTIGNEIFHGYKGNPGAEADDVLLDQARDAALAADPAALVERYNLLFLSGQMSPRLKQLVVQRVAAIPNANNGRDRVQEALFLTLNAPEYVIQK